MNKKIQLVILLTSLITIFPQFSWGQSCSKCQPGDKARQEAAQITSTYPADEATVNMWREFNGRVAGCNEGCAPDLVTYQVIPNPEKVGRSTKFSCAVDLVLPNDTWKIFIPTESGGIIYEVKMGKKPEFISCLVQRLQGLPPGRCCPSGILPAKPLIQPRGGDPSIGLKLPPHEEPKFNFDVPKFVFLPGPVKQDTCCRDTTIVIVNCDSCSDCKNGTIPRNNLSIAVGYRDNGVDPEFRSSSPYIGVRYETELRDTCHNWWGLRNGVEARGFITTEQVPCDTCLVFGDSPTGPAGQVWIYSKFEVGKPISSFKPYVGARYSLVATDVIEESIWLPNHQNFVGEFGISYRFNSRIQASAWFEHDLLAKRSGGGIEVALKLGSFKEDAPKKFFP